MPLQDAVDVVVALTQYVYTPAAVEETIRAFQELCDIEAYIEEDVATLRFHLKSDSPSTVCDEFLN